MAMSISEVVAENVRREMNHRSWTQTELARRCRLPQPRISEVLQGIYDHRIGTIEKLAQAFGLPMSVLVTPRPADYEKISS